MRGEHHSGLQSATGKPGSSPHARGALRKCYPSIRTDGIIPACAGSTRCSTSSCPACWDHPRMRGEHSPGRPTSTARSGSSPHARGALFVTSWARFKTGIIPACAGSTPCRRPCAKRRADHPRMRGEHIDTTGPDTFVKGSSPHARGARTFKRYQVKVAGIIPACAGSTIGTTSCTAGRRDHPRMRGEHSR